MMTVSKAKQDDEELVVEEDWSEIMTTDLSDGFAQHEHRTIALANGTTLQIASTPTLSPLDMINLSYGTHDTTGHRIWMGATFFLQAIPRLEESYFRDKSILELGSGTGLSGIAVTKSTKTKEVILTDSSESALDLCRHNCQANHLSAVVQVEELSWGKRLTAHKDFDTVLATDVLYDISSWKPLLRTVYQSLRSNGLFLLSHIPRAALPEDTKTTTLEEYLVSHAESSGFSLLSKLYPRDLSSCCDNWEDMQEAGAAIFAFEKR